MDEQLQRALRQGLASMTLDELKDLHARVLAAMAGKSAGSRERLPARVVGLIHRRSGFGPVGDTRQPDPSAVATACGAYWNAQARIGPKTRDEIVSWLALYGLKPAERCSGVTLGRCTTCGPVACRFAGCALGFGHAGVHLRSTGMPGYVELAQNPDFESFERIRGVGRGFEDRSLDGSHP